MTTSRATMQTPSPDAPESSRERDFLRRWPQARTIYDLILNSPPEWSLRIGVYGGWGEGKTTVLSFIRNLARQNGLRVAWFNPSNAQERIQMWFAFYLAIEEAFDYPNVAKPLLNWSGEQSVPWMAFTRINKKLTDVAEPGMPVVQQELRRDIERLIETVPEETKLIVMIDDLDRVSPELVTDLLIGLIESFNIPRCAYVMGLDPNIVAQSLPRVHPGWGTTAEFLEKVIDFPFWLSTPMREDLLRLANAELQRAPIQIDRQALQEVIDLMPHNPRKLKQFLRRLWRLKGALKRHDQNEVNWLLLLLIDLMRTVSPDVADRLLRSDSFRNHLLASQLQRRVGSGDSEAAARDRWIPDVYSVVDQVKEGKAVDVEGLLRVITAMRERTFLPSEDHIRYWSLISDEPPIFTSKEFRELIEEWTSDQSQRKLEQLVATHAQRREVPKTRVFRDLFPTALEYREARLSRAADSDTESVVRQEWKSADTALAIISIIVSKLRAFRDDQSILDSSHFKLLFEHCQKWAHVRQTDVSVAARETERQALAFAANDGLWFASEILEHFRIWHPPKGMEPAAQNLEHFVVGVFIPVILADLRARFSSKDGIASLWGRDRHLIEKHLLFRRDAGFYTTETIEHLQMLAGSAKADEDVQTNFLEFLRMLAYGLTETLTPVSHDDLLALARDRVLMPMAWKAATWNRLQPGILDSLKKTRVSLAELQGSDMDLPLPHWWEAEQKVEPSTEPV